MKRVMFMKKYMTQMLQSLVIAGLFPAVIIAALSNAYGRVNSQAAETTIMPSSHQIVVINEEGKTETMELEQYITGVVLGEVSPQFHIEALKAQAVAARTYTIYCIEVLKKHSIGAVCKDYRCCQSYCDPAVYLKNGGTNQGLERIITAIESTAGEILCYDTNVICATYFASSGGQTEDALEIWGETYPYLKAVNSPGEEDCGYFSQQVSLTPSELQTTLGVSLSGTPKSWFGIVKSTVGGGVDLMRIGGKLYTGTELRKLFNLRSTIFTICATEDLIIIDTKGYGHRVGLSQHGANAMAQRSSGYLDILCHYYSGVTLEHL